MSEDVPVAKHIIWVAANERGETRSSSISPEKAKQKLAWNSQIVDVHRCEAMLPIPVVATIVMQTEPVKS